MRAKVGDVLVVRGAHAGDPDRTGRITEVRSADGGPPYTVCWDDDGHVGLVFPGADALVRAAPPAASAGRRR